MQDRRNKHGGARPGAGRPAGQKGKPCQVYFQKDVLEKIKPHFPGHTFSNFVNVACRAQYRKGKGAELTAEQFCADILGVPVDALKDFIKNQKI